MLFVPNRPINNEPALVQVMAWRQTGDKPWILFKNSLLETIFSCIWEFPIILTELALHEIR